ncbi:MAG: RNA-binding protein [Myxococcota bacterium]|jgi:RNA-binding protein
MQFINQDQARDLKGQAHKLKPVVIAGKEGITEAIVNAVDQALTTHELIKVKLLKSAEIDKDDAAADLAKRTGAQLIQRIGRMTILYRPNPEEPEQTPGGKKRHGKA